MPLLFRTGRSLCAAAMPAATPSVESRSKHSELSLSCLEDTRRPRGIMMIAPFNVLRTLGPTSSSDNRPGHPSFPVLVSAAHPRACAALAQTERQPCQAAM